MEKLSRFVLGHRRLVGALTLVLMLAGGGALALVLPNASERNDYPGLPAYEANRQIMQTYGTGGYERPFVPVVTLPDGVTVTSPGVREALAGAFGAITDDARVVSYADTGDPAFVGHDGRTTFGLVHGPRVEQGGLPGSALGEGSDLGSAVAEAMRPHLPTGAVLHVTGLDPLATGADTGGLDVPLKLVITVVGAIAVLVWVFRSVLALVPLLTAFVAVPVSFIGLLVASAFIEVHETTVIMLPLFGIGIAVDYALILVSRWREERARGGDGEEAVHRAMATAGHAIVFSGGAVAIGLVTMVVLPVPLLRSLGVGGMVVTLASALVSLTVLPVLLARASAKPPRPERRWTAWARLVVRHRVPALLLSAGALVGLSVIALGLNLSVPVTDDLARSGSGHDGLVALREAGVPSGVLTSFDVYVPPGRDAARVAAEVAALPGVHAVTAPDDARWRVDGSALVTVLPVPEGGSDAGERLIRQVRAAVPDGVLVGGNAAQQLDYVDVTYSAFPWMLALLAAVTFVMLARAFRSLLLPLKAILLNLLSLGAVLGAMVVVWQWAGAPRRCSASGPTARSARSSR